MSSRFGFNAITMLMFRLTAGLVLWCVSQTLVAQTTLSPIKKPLIVTTPYFTKTTQGHSVYFLKLLELAFKNTEATDGHFLIQQYPVQLTSARFMAELARDNGVVNVLWATNEKNRNSYLRPIKISLLKNLDDYRIFLIRSGEQDRFNSIKSLIDLQKLVAGEGNHWPDTDIMRDNGLHCVTSPHYELLFSMLLNKRFDYFPRGLYEIWNEKDAYNEKPLAIEEKLMLHFSAPVYFYVNKSDEALANRIERGLKIAQENGDIDKLFFSVPGFKRGYDELKKNNRLVIELNSEDYKK